MESKNTTQGNLIEKESEKVIERKFYNDIKRRGGMCIKLLPDFFSGIPDRLILLPNSVIFFVELKTTRVSARKLQQIIHKRIETLGFKVYVIDTVESALSIADNHIKGNSF